jgi:hypothetical protein
VIVVVGAIVVTGAVITIVEHAGVDLKKELHKKILNKKNICQIKLE